MKWLKCEMIFLLAPVKSETLSRHDGRDAYCRRLEMGMRDDNHETCKAR